MFSQEDLKSWDMGPAIVVKNVAPLPRNLGRTFTPQNLKNTKARVNFHLSNSCFFNINILFSKQQYCCITTSRLKAQPNLEAI